MEVTFLTAEQIEGRNALEVMKRYGVRAGMSDLAIVLGGLPGVDRALDGQRAGLYWSASSTGSGFVGVVHSEGFLVSSSPKDRVIGARPALPLSETSQLQPRKLDPVGGVNVVQYGEYPQAVAPALIHTELEEAFSKGRLEITGKKYTFDGEEDLYSDNPFQAKEHPEYQHNGQRYIRVEAKVTTSSSCWLSNGDLSIAGKGYWIEVQPVEWLVDPTGLWVTRQVLFCGVPLDRKEAYDDHFENTDMHGFLNGPFLQEMQASPKIEQQAAKADASALAEPPIAEKSGADTPVKKYGANVPSPAQRLADLRGRRARLTPLPPQDLGR